MVKMYCNNCEKEIFDWSTYFELSQVNAIQTLSTNPFDEIQLCNFRCIEEFAAKMTSGGSRNATKQG